MNSECVYYLSTTQRDGKCYNFKLYWSKTANLRISFGFNNQNFTLPSPKINTLYKCRLCNLKINQSKRQKLKSGNGRNIHVHVRRWCCVKQCKMVPLWAPQFLITHALEGIRTKYQSFPFTKATSICSRIPNTLGMCGPPKMKTQFK